MWCGVLAALAEPTGISSSYACNPLISSLPPDLSMGPHSPNPAPRAPHHAPWPTHPPRAGWQVWLCHSRLGCGIYQPVTVPLAVTAISPLAGS